MFRHCLIAGVLYVICCGQTLLKNFPDVTGSNPTKFTIAFDGSYYYMAAAGKPEKIYKVNVSTGNIVAQSPTPLADFRALAFMWDTSQLIGKTADSGNSSSGHGVYVIDRTTLTLGERISNVVIGVPDSAVTYNKESTAWGWWNTTVPKAANALVLEYKLSTNPSTSFATIHPFPNDPQYPLPDITPATRMHLNPIDSSWVYYESSTFYLGYSSRFSFDNNNIFPNVNSSNFVGYTDDGLAWLYDGSNGNWTGFYLDDNPYCNGFRFSSNDQVSCSSIVPSAYPETCYSTNAYFNYTDGPFICGVDEQRMTFIRHWVIWDLWGNAENVNQTVSINLTPASSLEPSNNVEQTCLNTEPFQSNGNFSTSYTCTGPVSYVDIIIPQGCLYNYTLVRQWSYVGCRGNTTYNQTAVYRDSKAPIISHAPNITVNYEQPISPPNATDECTPPNDLTIYYNDTLLYGGVCSKTSLYSRVWTVVDSCNNTATITQFISIYPPEIQVPSDIAVECTGSIPSPNVTGLAKGQGNYTTKWFDSIFVNTQCTPQNPLYLYVTRNWTVNDLCGQNTGDQHISIQDSQDPILQVPQDVVVSCNSSSAPSSTGYAKANDACDGNLNVSYVDSTTVSFACNQNQTITRTWTTTDKCGHSVSNEQTIYKVDLIAPYFVVPPPNKIVWIGQRLINQGKKNTCNPPSLTQLGNFLGNVTIADNCDPTPTYQLNYNWTCDNFFISWTLKDECGNTNTYIQNITLLVHSSEGFTLVYPSFILLALLFGWRMLF